MARIEHLCDNTKATTGQAMQEQTDFLSASRLINAHNTFLFVTTAAPHQLSDAHS